MILRGDTEVQVEGFLMSKVAKCPDETCEAWHCCACGVTIQAEVKNFGAMTVLPPAIGEFMVCQKCFDAHTSKERSSDA